MVSVLLPCIAYAWVIIIEQERVVVKARLIAIKSKIFLKRQRVLKHFDVLILAAVSNERLKQDKVILQRDNN